MRYDSSAISEPEPSSDEFYGAPLTTRGRYIHAPGVEVMLGEGDTVGDGIVGTGVPVGSVGESVGVTLGVAVTAVGERLGVAVAAASTS